MVPYISRITGEEHNFLDFYGSKSQQSPVPLEKMQTKVKQKPHFAASEPLPIKWQSSRFSKDFRGINQYLQYWKNMMNRDAKIE